LHLGRTPVERFGVRRFGVKNAKSSRNSRALRGDPPRQPHINDFSSEEAMEARVLHLLRALRDLRAAFDTLAPQANSLTLAESTLLRGRMCEAVDAMQRAGLRTDRVSNTLREMALSAGRQWVGDPHLDELIGCCVDQLYEPTKQKQIEDLWDRRAAIQDGLDRRAEALAVYQQGHDVGFA
jgi:hypothetical protein